MGTYNYFIDENIAPYAAHHIGVYDSNGDKVGNIRLGAFKPEYGERLLRFGLLSDVHNTPSLNESYAVSEDFQNALTWLNQKESIQFTCITGDLTYNGNNATEYQLFCQNRDALSDKTPVYACTGNHDAGSGGLNSEMWKQYIGSNPTYYFYNEATNSYFVFLSMNKWSLGTSGVPYTEEDITLMENWIPKMTKFSKVFIFTHLFFPDRAGNFKQIYPSGNWLSGTQLTRLEALADNYPNQLWMSGHSHWKWYLQQYEPTENVFPNLNETSYCLHVPSCAYPIDSNGVSTRTSKPAESEGAVIDVYKDYVDIRSIIFKETSDSDYVNDYLPIGQYRLNMPEDPNIDEYNVVNWTLDQEDAHNEIYKYTSDFIDVRNTKGYYLSMQQVLIPSDIFRGTLGVYFEAYDSNKTLLGICKDFNIDSSEEALHQKECFYKDVTMSLKYSYPNTAYIKCWYWKKWEDNVNGQPRLLTTKLYENYLRAENFFEGSTAREGQFKVTNLEDGYILIEYPTLIKAGNFVRTPSWYSGCTYCSLKVEDVQWVQEPTVSSLKDKFGFCTPGGAYVLESTDNLRFSYPKSGVEFNVASSYVTGGQGNAPVSLKLKAVLYYKDYEESEVVTDAEYVRKATTFVNTDKTATPEGTIDETVTTDGDIELSFTFAPQVAAQGYILSRADSQITASSSKVYWTYDNLVVKNKDGLDITSLVEATTKLGFYKFNGGTTYSTGNNAYTNYVSNKDSENKVGIQFNVSSSYNGTGDADIVEKGPFTVTFTNLRLSTSPFTNS